jgi:hypothetical protein
MSLNKCEGLLLVLNPLKAELNPICHLLALLGAHHILRVSGIRVKFPNLLFNFMKPKLPLRK